jgi:hypothetical protein
VPETTPASPDDLLTIHVIGLPIALQAQAQEHSDELTRELTLIGAQLAREGNTHHLPAHLLNLIAQLTARFSSFTVEQERQLADATARRDETIDLTYRLPASAAEAAHALGDMLDEADAYCRSGQHLLTLATPPELVTYRRWFLAQITGQVAGAPAVSWDHYLRQTAT